jgi:GT2 family glycosyltransferase
MLEQPVAGKSRALNIGIEAVEGRLVVLADDDAIPSPSFLEAWAQFLEERGNYALYGGAIDVLFETPQPKWLIETRLHFALMFAERNLQEGPIGPDEIYGPNMAIRRSVFDQGFPYDQDIGANGTDPNYPMGEETEFCRRVVQSGVGCWFAREPRVQHIVRSHQVWPRTRLSDVEARPDRSAAVAFPNQAFGDAVALARASVQEFVHP